jgi:hypothetical protein
MHVCMHGCMLPVGCIRHVGCMLHVGCSVHAWMGMYTGINREGAHDTELSIDADDTETKRDSHKNSSHITFQKAGTGMQGES